MHMLQERQRQELKLSESHGWRMPPGRPQKDALLSSRLLEMKPTLDLQQSRLRLRNLKGSVQKP
jgi:hypothetical protein